MTREKKKAEPTAEAIIPEENKAELTIVAEPQSTQLETKIETPSDEIPEANKAKPSSFGRNLWRAFVFLLKLGLTLAILGAIGIGLYIGVPIVYDKYILPVQNNTSRLAILETHQNQNDQQLADLQSQLAAVAAEQAKHSQSITEFGSRVQTLEDEIAAHTKSLAALEEMQSTLKAGGETTNAELERQVSLLKGMELLSRARLFLYQSNFGLAKQDIQAARNILAVVQPSAPEPLDTELAEVVHRLDLTLSSLPNFPVAASDDLDIAWQILLQGIPQTPSDAEAVAPTLIPEGALTPESAATPAPTPTLVLEATPANPAGASPTFPAGASPTLPPGVTP